jgi:hypothetical protein
VDWGTVPAWVAAIGTVLAFAVTFALLLSEIRLRRAQAADQEMRQARLVWVEMNGTKISPSQGKITMVTRPVVHNASDETIHGLFVRVYDEFDQHLGDTVPAAASLRPRSEVACYLRVVAPLENARGFGSMSAELFFTDAEGRRWKKGRDERLMRQLRR